MENAGSLNWIVEMVVEGRILNKGVTVATVNKEDDAAAGHRGRNVGGGKEAIGVRIRVGGHKARRGPEAMKQGEVHMIIGRIQKPGIAVSKRASSYIGRRCHLRPGIPHDFALRSLGQSL